MKRALAKEQLKFGDVSKFKDACDIVGWCSTTLSTGSSENSIIQQYFWLVEEDNILNHLDCDTISGSTKWHSFKSSKGSTWNIWIRKLACFYGTCIIGDSKSCGNTKWVE